MAESTSAKVSRIALEADGSIGDPETFVNLGGTVPDGVALDQGQNLYVACYTPDLILRVDANRRVTRLIEDRTSEVLNRPTNVAFRPTEDTRLYIANLGGLHVNCLDVGVRGQPLNYPRLR
jgi:sugar lactone lactonase YvrE